MDGYSQRQAERDAEHSAAYKKWVRDLPDHERARLIEKGLDKPLKPVYGRPPRKKGELEEEREDSQLTECVVEQWSEQRHRERSIEVPLDRIDDGTIRVLEAIRRLALLFQTTRKPGYEADALAYACRLSELQGLSMATIAKRWHVTREAFRMKVKKHCEDFGIPLPPGRKKEGSGEKYRARNQRNRKTPERI